MAALLIQANDSVPGIQVEKYIEDGTAELVWIFPAADWALPYMNAFLEEVRQAGLAVSSREPRPRRRHPVVEVRLGQDTRRVRTLILRVLTGVYEVDPLGCKLSLLNVPGAAPPP